jgi:hypothetical protein
MSTAWNARTDRLPGKIRGTFAVERAGWAEKATNVAATIQTKVKALRMRHTKMNHQAIERTNGELIKLILSAFGRQE